MDHTADNLLKYDINREQSMLFGTGFALVQIFKPARRASLGLAISNDNRPGERKLSAENNRQQTILRHLAACLARARFRLRLHGELRNHSALVTEADPSAVTT